MPLTTNDLCDIDGDCDVNFSQFITEKLANHLAFKTDWSDADHFYVKSLLRMPHGIIWFDEFLHNRPGHFPYQQSRLEILDEKEKERERGRETNYRRKVCVTIGILGIASLTFYGSAYLL